MKEFVYAIKLLTIIPIGRKQDVADVNAGTGACWFPLVGLLIGIAAAAVYWLLGQVLPHSVALVFVMAFVIFITGALHVDGLADSADGLFGGRSPDERLRIMRDHSVGIFGILAVVIVLALRYISLVELHNDSVAIKLLCTMPMVGRWSILLAACISPYARAGEGTGKLTVETTRPLHFCLGSIFPLAACLVVLHLSAVVMLAITFIIVPLVILFMSRKIGGMTGDTLGAVSEIAETIFVVSYIPAASLISVA